MFTSNTSDALAFAYERARQLREETAAKRLRRAAKTGCSLAALLRRAADRIDPPPLAHRAV